MEDQIWRMVGSLVVVVGLLLLVARFGARRMRGGAGSPVRVLHRASLSKTAGLSLVSVGHRVLLQIGHLFGSARRNRLAAAVF